MISATMMEVPWLSDMRQTLYMLATGSGHPCLPGSVQSLSKR